MMIAKLDGPRAGAQPGGADALMILFHGYGADGHDLIGLAPAFQRKFPRMAFVSPHAPDPCEMSPAGRQWWPISRLDPAAMYAGVQSVADAVARFIDEETARYGVAPGRLVLAGFSQGCMLALHVGLRRASAPACILGMSGMLPGAERLPAEARARPPVLLTHGEADDVIPAQALFMTGHALALAGIPAVWRLSAGIGHGIAPDALDLAVAFVDDALSGRLKGEGGASTPLRRR